MLPTEWKVIKAMFQTTNQLLCAHRERERERESESAWIGISSWPCSSGTRWCSPSSDSYELFFFITKSIDISTMNPTVHLVHLLKTSISSSKSIQKPGAPTWNLSDLSPLPMWKTLPLKETFPWDFQIIGTLPMGSTGCVSNEGSMFFWPVGWWFSENLIERTYQTIYPLVI